MKTKKDLIREYVKMQQEPRQSANISEHTPTPWKVSAAVFVCSIDPQEVLAENVKPQDAVFIVRAVNEYQADKKEIARLKKVIQEGKQYWEGFNDGEYEAIAKAEGK